MPLLVDPAALPRWVSADALVFLVGGYDGNASFGDVAQLLGALRAVGSGADLVTPVVVVEAGLRDEHCRIAATWPADLEPRLVAYFAGPGEHVPDGLIPLPSLANAIGVALYFYGGGYANPLWGARKAAMAGAVRDWVSGPWPELDGPPVLATGLQVDAGLTDDADGLGPWLRRARFLTGRDGASVRTLSEVNGRATLGPDDALGLILDAGAGERGATTADRLRVGVHVNVETYSTVDPDRRRSLVAEVVASVCARDTRPADIVPILAYEGARVRESETFSAVAPVLEAAGSVIADPIDLSSAHGVAQLSSLDAVIACSYHVALACAVMDVPAWLVVDNEYYQQKLRGIEDQIGAGRVGAVRAADAADSTMDVVPVPAGVIAAGRVDPELLRHAVVAARAEVGQAVALSLLEQWSRHVDALSRAHAEAAADAARLRSVVGDYIHAVEASAQREIRMQGEVDATNEQVEGLLRQADALRAQLRAMEQSRIWRMSAPYRRLRNRRGGSGDAG